MTVRSTNVAQSGHGSRGEMFVFTKLLFFFMCSLAENPKVYRAYCDYFS